MNVQRSCYPANNNGQRLLWSISTNDLGFIILLACDTMHAFIRIERYKRRFQLFAEDGQNCDIACLSTSQNAAQSSPLTWCVARSK